ncbi:hypothetical protein E2P81_ATG04193 [Venturia nashicola]|uniref:Uncharacterized protein n=1 Tax=Venturia nashicola TaxID=86259 RepID=A0A4Z1PCR9_9PEZI|nr:hypothetical protein E6O75_ATG04294 [Venturia nashicola]TLD37381.1 hypothetical protein E2P81_ATG04193 [Venturia nashicola]
MANVQNQVPTYTIRHSLDASAPQTLPPGISQYIIDSTIIQATQYTYPRNELSLRFYDGPRPHTTVILGHKEKSLHLHVVDGKEKYVEVMQVMEKTVKCGWYRRVEVVKRTLEEGGGEVLVKKWVCLVDGREVVVEGMGEGWGRCPVREGVAWW